MFRFVAAAVFCVSGGMCSAAPLSPLDLTLKLDSTGFTNVSIYDEFDTKIDEFAYLSAEDDPWGITKPFERFSIDEEISFNATFDEASGQLSSCETGAFSCAGSFGTLGADSFSLGDGMGVTAWGDFNMEGGTNAGDSVSLEVFDGAPTFEFRAGDGYVLWDTYVHNFSVLGEDDGFVDRPSVGVVPLPASILFLAVGLGGFGILRRSSKRRLS